MPCNRLCLFVNVVVYVLISGVLMLAVFKRNEANSVDRTKEEFWARRDSTRKQCSLTMGEQREHNFPSGMLNYVYVDDAHRFMYCVTPKIASTQWLKIMLLLSGHMNTSDPGDLDSNKTHHEYRTTYLRKLGSYSYSRRVYMMNSYTKAMFTRDPLERLLSAFSNKFGGHHNNTYFNVRHGRQIIRRYRPGATKRELRLGSPVYFHEFIRYVISDNMGDAHWLPQSSLCDPCTMDYDYYGRYESMARDSRFILERIRSGQVTFPKLKRPSSTRGRMGDAYRAIPASLIRELYSYYLLDYKLFNYFEIES